MKFFNKHNHPVSLVDGREVASYGEVEMTKEQYETHEQWQQLADLFSGVSPAGEKVVQEALDNPSKFENQAEAEPTADAPTTGGTT